MEYGVEFEVGRVVKFVICNVGKFVFFEVVEEMVIVVDDVEGGFGVDFVKFLVGDVGVGIF